MVGIILRNIRKIKGLTQEQVGNQLKIAENTISNYETEYSNITFDTAIKFLNACDFEMQFVNKETGKIYTIKELSREMDF